MRERERRERRGRRKVRVTVGGSLKAGRGRRASLTME